MFSDKLVGHLTLILGPMYSGKSTKLINYARKFKIINKKFLIFKHNIDNRYETDYICSHNLDKEPCICIDDIYKIFDHKEYNNSDIIIIEEAQFFKKLIDPIKKMIDIKCTSLFLDANSIIYDVIHENQAEAQTFQNKDIYDKVYNKIIEIVDKLKATFIFVSAASSQSHQEANVTRISSTIII
jgi:hypothetical protein